jgi:DnaJ-class molecular chaperone
MREKGIPNVRRGGKSGDLLIKIAFAQPAKPSKKAKELLKELEKEGF